MQLELATALHPQVTCELKVLLDDGELNLRATVRRCRAWGYALGENDQRVLLYRAGVEFPELSGELLERLRGQLVEEASAVSPVPHVEEAGGAGSEPVPPVAAPGGPAVAARKGPVKIRIASERVRKLMQNPEE